MGVIAWLVLIFEALVAGLGDPPRESGGRRVPSGNGPERVPAPPGSFCPAVPDGDRVFHGVRGARIPGPPDRPGILGDGVRGHAGHLTGIVGFVALLGVLAGLMTTAAGKAFHLVVWFPEHVLRWIGSSGSPMGTEGESQKTHNTVVAGVAGIPSTAEKGAGKLNRAGSGTSGRDLAAPPHPGDASVQGQEDSRG